MDYKDILPLQINAQMIKVSFLYRILTNNAYLSRMNMIKIIYLFVILLMLTACNGTRVSEKLNQIDSLIVKEQYDSACVLLKEASEVPMTEEDQAHYRLLATQLGFITNHPLPTDSLLDMAITYYKKVGNHQKLADAYYYKSVWAETKNNYPQAILYGKEAEQLAMNTDNTRLQYKIAENLAYLNGLCRNEQLQLQYAKKALTVAHAAQNKNWIAYSYNNISFAFRNLGQYDSACFYIEKSIPYSDYIYDNPAKQGSSQMLDYSIKTRILKKPKSILKKQ